jgi:hypothetical protein
MILLLCGVALATPVNAAHDTSPTATPFQAQVLLTNDGTQISVRSHIDVPAGFTLLVEEVSGDVSCLAGQPMVSIGIGTFLPVGPGNHLVPLVGQATDNGVIFASTRRIYAQGSGDSAGLNVIMSGASQCSASVALSGQLIPQG